MVLTLEDFSQVEITDALHTSEIQQIALFNSIYLHLNLSVNDVGQLSNNETGFNSLSPEKTEDFSRIVTEETTESGLIRRVSTDSINVQQLPYATHSNDATSYDTTDIHHADRDEDRRQQSIKFGHIIHHSSSLCRELNQDNPSKPLFGAISIYNAISVAENFLINIAG